MALRKFCFPSNPIDQNKTRCIHSLQFLTDPLFLSTYSTNNYRIFNTNVNNFHIEQSKTYQHFPPAIPCFPSVISGISLFTTITFTIVYLHRINLIAYKFSIGSTNLQTNSLRFIALERPISPKSPLYTSTARAAV